MTALSCSRRRPLSSGGVLFAVIVVLICGGCLAGYIWLGKTATPGQKAIEARVKEMRWSFWRSIGGRARAGDADWWTGGLGAPRHAVPEPDEHKEGWRQ